MFQDEQKTIDFYAIRLRLASPDAIHAWSHGEVTRPETINYRTQKPEKGGLFAEEIFGPSKDWECYCGKYKRIRYKGIVCDKCGVEVTRSLVRRERMGHIDLAAPVSHIWFLRGVPSKIGLVLDLSIQDLEKVIYFANFIITKVDEKLREETLAQIDAEFQSKRKTIEGEFQKTASAVKQRKAEAWTKAADEVAREKAEAASAAELAALQELRDEQCATLAETVELAKRELKGLQPLQVVSENVYQDLSLKYGHVFDAGIGAEAVRELLAVIDLKKHAQALEVEAVDAPENRKRRLIRRLRLIKSLEKNGLRPEWMVLTAIPIIPPDLRPMVQLDGGRFATSDLNDLYRRVINRNNRLKRLLELNAPEVICRNEKRMLQEAVDALIDNSARHGKTVTASTGQKRMLKSIADMLKGKQGRFRQNLLGKRVDYSGRSVIVIGPHLRLGQCGIPKRMALELFRPFVISQLIKREYVHNVRSASRFIETGRAEVWDILEEVTKNAHVLLNRAPTLHRLGIQAFQPILIEGKAIQIHPLVCAAFNADFDGDQMAVHVPLTEQAKWEAREIMLSTKNLLKPATGQPVVTPSQDIVLGCFYMSLLRDVPESARKRFADEEEAIMAYETGHIAIQDAMEVVIDGKRVVTNIGRLIFNRTLPPSLRYVNAVLDKKTLSGIVSRSIAELGQEETVLLLDRIKALSFKYLTRSGISWGMDDLRVPDEKRTILQKAEKRVDEIQRHYEAGLLTEEERHMKVIEEWAQVREEITTVSRKSLVRFGPVYAMIESGSRGSWSQITQMMGMKGLVTNPAGETIELPVKASFKEGFDVLEYFISTHGARKGLSDTALRTANAGYLTRRLIDVAQDMVISQEDCGDDEGFVLTQEDSEEIGESLAQRAWGRVVAKKIVDPKSRKTVVKAGGVVTSELRDTLLEVPLEAIRVRSVLTCRAFRGVCQQCYGYDLGHNRLVSLGCAVGIIAAQSIGEPGTQLTMRTFHTGGVAGQDITQGLPRVEELFEARPVKKPAILSDIDGVVRLDERNGQRLIIIEALGKRKKEAAAPAPPAKGEAPPVGGPGEAKEYVIPGGYALWVKDKDRVERGDPLTEGSLNLSELYTLKGKEAVQRYLIKEIQYIYSSQGQKLNDKHIEIIIRQIFSRRYVKETGDTDFLAGEIIDETQIRRVNDQMMSEGKKPAESEELLLGITKASLTTDSFLSAASFQETARVLIDAAVSGKIDYLRGLKENVIIGRLIPAGTGFGAEASTRGGEAAESAATAEKPATAPAKK